MPEPSNAAQNTGARSVRRYLPWLGILLLVWLLSRFDLRALGAALLRVEPWAVAQAALLFSVNLLLKSLRWQRMLGAQGLRLPTPVAVAAFFSSQFYGQVTFGRVGELYRAEALIERGVPMGTALSSSVYDRLLDLAAVLLAGATLAAWVVGDATTALLAALGVALLLLFALAVLHARKLAAFAPVARLRGWLAARRGTRGLLGMLAQLLAGLGPLLRPGFVLEAAAWTAAAWLLYFASLWQLAAGMGLAVTRVSLTAAGALGALSALLPVTVNGLGAREVIFMQVLGVERVAGERAIVLSLLHLTVMSAAAIALGLLGMLARHRQQASSASRASAAGVESSGGS
jgi:uncharacterized protein (TIRG00374 family)